MTIDNHKLKFYVLYIFLIETGYYTLSSLTVILKSICLNQFFIKYYRSEQNNCECPTDSLMADYESVLENHYKSVRDASA